ncbi:hypothetical protein Hte_008253 [Hypoxylon texense]
MPGRKGYDMTWVIKGDRPPKSKNIQQGSSSFNTTGSNPLERATPFPLHTTKARQESTDQPPRLSPGYTKSTNSQYTVYNRKTGRGWLRRSKSIDSSLPVAEQADQDSSPGVFPSLTRMVSSKSHMSRRTDHNRAGMRKSIGSIAHRAIDRATRASLTARRLLTPTRAHHDPYRLAQLPALIHPSSLIAPEAHALIAEREVIGDMRFLSVPDIIVTSPSDDEDNEDDDDDEEDVDDVDDEDNVYDEDYDYEVGEGNSQGSSTQQHSVMYYYDRMTATAY